VKRLVAAAVLALAVASPAAACTSRFSMAKVEGQVMCPVCGTTLDQSDSAAAQQIRNQILVWRSHGWTDCQVRDALVRNYGQSILAEPPKRGLDLLAWLLPLVGIVLAGTAIGVGAWRWSRSREPETAFEPALNGHRRLDPELERRVDEELARFD
jgi:cytochrome c-type biogenesis protein CcmH